METASIESSLSPSPFTLPQTPTSRRAPRRRIDGQKWPLVERLPNQRRRAHTSAIWYHGCEYFKANQLDTSHLICDHCDSRISFRKDQSPFNVARHLSGRHHVTVKRSRSETIIENEEKEESFAAESTMRQRQKRLLSVVTAVNIEEFRRQLVQWVVRAQIPYRKVSNNSFKNLLLSLQPAIERYLINSAVTITEWCNSDHNEAFEHDKLILHQSRSQIHLTFDI